MNKAHTQTETDGSMEGAQQKAIIAYFNLVKVTFHSPANFIALLAGCWNMTVTV